jgi:hypothetical protein
MACLAGSTGSRSMTFAVRRTRNGGDPTVLEHHCGARMKNPKFQEIETGIAVTSQ